MVALVGGAVTGWASFPPEIKDLGTNVAGGSTTIAERVVAAPRPGLSVGWTVTNLAGHGWLVQAEEMTDRWKLQHEVRLRDERLTTLAGAAPTG